MNNVTYIKRYKDCTEAGFDLTSISAMKWFKMLTRYDLTYTQRKSSYDGKPTGGFVWGFKDGHIVTANNPLHGDYSHAGQREPEIGYASYIGITGTKSFVRKVRAYIKKHASDIKDECVGRRDFI